MKASSLSLEDAAHSRLLYNLYHVKHRVGIWDGEKPGVHLSWCVYENLIFCKPTLLVLYHFFRIVRFQITFAVFF